MIVGTPTGVESVSLPYISCFVLQDNAGSTPILTIRLELSGSQVVFNPKLDENDATSSVQEYVEAWIEEFLKRADMVKPFEPGLKVRITISRTKIMGFGIQIFVTHCVYYMRTRVCVFW